MKIKSVMYCHSSKDENYSFINSIEDEYGLSLSNDVKREFSYALYEVKFDVEIDTYTGNVDILAVDGKKLVK
jgi:hypothetical protein